MPRMIAGRGPYPDDYIPWEPVSLYHRPVRTGWLVERGTPTRAPRPVAAGPMRLLDRLGANDVDALDLIEWGRAA